MTTLIATVLFSVWPFSNEQIKKEIEAIHNEVKVQFKLIPTVRLS